MGDTKTRELVSAQAEALAILNRTNRQAAESREIGVRTLEAMNNQTAQMERISLEAEDTDRILKQNMKTMKQMNRHWIRRLFCMCCTSPDTSAPAVKWHSDEATIKAMTGKTKEKYLKKRTKEKSGDSEVEVGAEVEAVGNDPVLPVISESAPLSDEDFEAHMESHLDKMLASVEDLKGIASEISVQSSVQEKLAEKLERKIQKNKDGVRGNAKMMGVLAPKLAKNDKSDQEYLSTTDKMLVQGAAASIKNKFGGIS